MNNLRDLLTGAKGVDIKGVEIKVSVDDLVRFYEQVNSLKEEMIEDRLLTTEETCQMVRVSRPTLHRWKQSGIIPYVKVGKNIRYYESDVRELLTTRRRNKGA